jgi:hypothetical protein
MQEFRQLLKKKLARNRISINKLAIELKVSDVIIRKVMSGKKTSRPLVSKIANYLSAPELLHVYEKELQERKAKKPKSKKEVKNHDKV